MKIPASHQAVMPYLMLNGAEGFIDFTRSVFGATETFKQLRPGNGKIMHAEIMINGSTIMFSEATEEWKPQTANLFIYAENVDDTYQQTLAKGATSIMEPANQEYGRSCGVRDPFGNVWWITAVQ